MSWRGVSDRTTFRRELLAQLPGHIGPNHFGRKRRESAEERAGRIVAETLSDLRLTPAEFQLLPAKAEVKVQLARRLRRETALSLKRIAQQPGLGGWKYWSNVLGQEAPKTAQAELGL